MKTCVNNYFDGGGGWLIKGGTHTYFIIYIHIRKFYNFILYDLYILCNCVIYTSLRIIKTIDFLTYITQLNCTFNFNFDIC